MANGKTVAVAAGLAFFGLVVFGSKPKIKVTVKQEGDKIQVTMKNNLSEFVNLGFNYYVDGGFSHTVFGFGQLNPGQTLTKTYDTAMTVTATASGYARLEVAPTQSFYVVAIEQPDTGRFAASSNTVTVQDPRILVGAPF